LLLISLVCSHLEVIPPSPSNGNSIAQFISLANGLDGPHVTPINASAFEWWYFDVVSQDADYNIAVIFFTAPGTAFPFDAAPANDILPVAVSLSTPENTTLLFTEVFAREARVTTTSNGASGDWEGTGCSFIGTPDLSVYSINLDIPSIALKVELSMTSIAPGHYPCGPIGAGEHMTIMPHIGWSNAIPDATSHVKITFSGTATNFSGIGYHDQNWGDQPFQNLVASWFWGHGRLGPYTVVWYDALTPSGLETVSGYIARDREIISVRCSSTVVRPTGATDSYPPVISSGIPSGNFHVTIDLGSEGTFVLNVTSKHLVIEAVPSYYRWTGTLTGGIVGRESFVGAALYEEFVLIP